jgi:hypothetical protein
MNSPVAEAGQVFQLQALDRWSELVNSLNSWFHKPDIEALEVALSTAISHYFKQDEPVWLMVLGPPGTGKSSTIMGALTSLHETYMLDDLTPTTLLSGWGSSARDPKKKRDCSLLNNIGTEADRSGILLMHLFHVEEGGATAGNCGPAPQGLRRGDG